VIEVKHPRDQGKIEERRSVPVDVEKKEKERKRFGKRRKDESRKKLEAHISKKNVPRSSHRDRHTTYQKRRNLRSK